MSFELTAMTEPGERLVALAERLSEEIGGRAADHDREASFPHESLAAVQQSGYLAASIPAELGGLGVTSLSMTPTALGDVAAVLAATSSERCEELAFLALQQPTADAARAAVRARLPVLDDLGL